MKRFKRQPPLMMNGFEYAEVASAAKVIFIGGSEEQDTFDVKEATALRDWLNKVLEVETHSERADWAQSLPAGAPLE